MAGQIIKRGERKWLLRVDMGRDETGKRHRLNQTVHGTKKEAQAILNKMLRDKDTSSLLEPTRQTLNTYLDQWLENAAKPRLGQDAYDDYVWLMKRYVRPVLGIQKLSQVTPSGIQALYGDMTNRGLAARTVEYTHTVLKGALEQAVKTRVIPHNPANNLDLPRKEHREMQAMTEEEAIASWRQQLVILIMCSSRCSSQPVCGPMKHLVSTGRTWIWRVGGSASVAP